jgi:hypothetical protein
MRKSVSDEQPRKLYRKPTLYHYHDIRTMTLGASQFPGESGGLRANPNATTGDFEAGTDQQVFD